MILDPIDRYIVSAHVEFKNTCFIYVYKHMRVGLYMIFFSFFYCFLNFFSMYFDFHLTSELPPSSSNFQTWRNLEAYSTSQAHWKSSDTLHYIVLVPIKADTICCQKNSDSLQIGSPPLQHPLPSWISMLLLMYYVVTCETVLSDGRPKV